MGKPIVAVDIDDVLADSTDSLRLSVNKRLGTQLTPEDYRVKGEFWGYYEGVWRAHGLLDRISWSDIEKEMIADQSHVPLIQGAAGTLEALSQRYEIALITSRPPLWQPATQTWIEDHFGSLVNSLHFAGHKDHHTQSKGELCVELGARYLIDDNVQHCRVATDLGIVSILFGHYGWHFGVPKGQISCKNWKEVEDYFDAL